MKKINIIIATHKNYRMPCDDMYLPLQVGAEGKESIGFAADNKGENISEKNKNYCELTGLYWAWMNLDADYIGLVHYRRHFSRNGFGDKWNRVITRGEMEALLSEYDVILPQKRNYLIESNYNQYIHAHHKEDLDIVRDIILEKFPEYILTYDSYMKKSKGHRFNMFVMERDILDRYCEWLFTILFELEVRLDISTYNDYDARVFGFVSERLLDVWILANNIQYKEIPYVFMEKQNWLVKGTYFLIRKVKGKKIKSKIQLKKANKN